MIKEGQLMDRGFASISLEEIKSNLESESNRSENKMYKHFLDDDEVIIKKNDLAETSIKLQALNEEKKDAMDEFKEKINPVREVRDELVLSLKTGIEFKQGDVYVFINDIEGQITFVDSRGIVVETRAIEEEERQLIIKVS